VHGAPWGAPKYAWGAPLSHTHRSIDEGSNLKEDYSSV